MKYDTQVSTEQARLRLPLKQLIEQYGHGPRASGEKWNSFTCGFCGQKAGSVYRGADGHDLFKCFYSGGKRGGPCPTGNVVLDESGYIAQAAGLSRKDGWIQWMKMAGVWTEERLSPSVMPGTRPRRKNSRIAALEIDSSPGASGPKPVVPVTSVGGALNAQQDSPPMLQTDPNGSLPSPDNPQRSPGEATLAPIAGADAKQAGDGASARPCASATADAAPGDASAERKELPPIDAEVVDEEVHADAAAGVPPGGGGAEPPADDDFDEAPGGEPTAPLLALRKFYEGCSLHPEDERLLFEKRGLVPKLCEAIGLKSTRAGAREVLVKLADEFPMEVLLQARLWVGGGPRRAKEVKPNPQFCGWGIQGKSKKAKTFDVVDEERKPSENDFDWGWTNPVLIPYFNAEGQLVHLRPHKGMSAGLSPRLYVVRTVAQSAAELYETVVICEGELKAIAGKQVLPEFGWCSLPGITMSKYLPVQQELLTWLKRVGAKKVIVAFDNEEKGDPRLPSYKEDPAKRHQTQIWARYLAKLLCGRSFDALVAWLPRDWRDENGKADWDGCLARIISGKIKITPSASTPDDVRAAFRKVIESAHHPDDYEQFNLFDSKEERIIKNGLVRLSYTPLLPYGGERERKLARTFARLATQKDFGDRAKAAVLAAKFRSVIGWYYRRAPLRMDKRLKENFEEAKLAAAASGNWDVQKFYEEYLKGPPEGVADFRLDCRFQLVKPNGKRELVVQLRNSLEISDLIILDPESFTAPRDFKCWVESHGPYTWMTGETELELLRHDVHHLASHQRVYELTHFGWHEKSKIWLADDCAIVETGAIVLPDSEGVIWWNGLGYLMSRSDWEGEGFKLGRPKWHPTKGLKTDKAGVSLFGLAEGEDDKEALRELFGEFCERLRETVGDYDAYMAIGAILAFAVAPEFYAREAFFIGLWLHGERGQGKSSVAGWLTRIWGFVRESGVKMPDSTRVGLQIVLQQYCNLPVWLEEYTKMLEESKVELLKSTHNRESPAKKEFENQQRQILTNPIVTGESTATKSALKQRFPHVQISSERRRGSHLEWFQRNSPFFFQSAVMCFGIAALLSSQRSRTGGIGVRYRK